MRREASWMLVRLTSRAERSHGPHPLSPILHGCGLVWSSVRIHPPRRDLQHTGMKADTAVLKLGEGKLLRNTSTNSNLDHAAGLEYLNFLGTRAPQDW